MLDDAWVVLIWCAIVSPIPERANSLAGQPSRPGRADHLERERDMRTVAVEVAAYPVEVWSALACGFFQFSVADAANQLLWTKCRGDIRSDLLMLGEGMRPKRMLRGAGQDFGPFAYGLATGIALPCGHGACRFALEHANG